MEIFCGCTSYALYRLSNQYKPNNNGGFVSGTYKPNNKGFRLLPVFVSRISKCKCGPAEPPVFPLLAINCPFFTTNKFSGKVKSCSQLSSLYCLSSTYFSSAS